MTANKEKISPPATVLVVDDNTDTVDILTRLLLRHDMNTLAAYSGQECLDIVRTQVVDVILLDVMMPGMDGLEVCEELKRLATKVPIILVTAKDDMATRAAGMTLGVSEFVVKPVNHLDLLERIQTQLAVRRWEQETDRTSAGLTFPKPSTTED
jgi:DNA-binding response OmpR family regulator